MTIHHAPTPEMFQVLETLPDLYLFLSPDLIILTASDAYLAATHKKREDLTGQQAWVIFPGNPAALEVDFTSPMRDSLQRVLATGKTHTLTLFRLDVPRPEQPGGGLEEKYWHCLNTPVLDREGHVLYIIQKLDDLTREGQIQQRKAALKTQIHSQLEASLDRERRALAQSEFQYDRLDALFEQSPVGIAIFTGPRYVIELANPAVCEIWGRSPDQVLGKPLFEALPEASGQGFEGLLDQVMRSGIPYRGEELPATINRAGRQDTVYFNFTYQPWRDEQGQIIGVMVAATEVSALVQARHKVEQSERNLRVLNEQLTDANEKIRATNQDLSRTQDSLRELNDVLEERVAARTGELKRAQTETERQKARLERFFRQAPAAICLLDGPDLVYELVNPGYQQMFPGRQLLGRPILEAMPEIAGHAVYDTFRHVYQTGITNEERELLVPFSRPEDGVLYWRTGTSTISSRPATMKGAASTACWSVVSK